MSVHRLRKPLRANWWIRSAIALGLAFWATLVLMPNLPSGNQKILIAKHALSPGESVTNADFAELTVSIGENNLYATERSLTKPLIVQRSLGVGELVPLASLGSRQVEQVPFALTLSAPVSSKIHAGSNVDVWATTSHLGEVTSAPEVIAFRVVVSKLVSDTSLGKTTTLAEVWVSPTFIQGLLLAQANGSTISLVLNPTLADAN